MLLCYSALLLELDTKGEGACAVHACFGSPIGISLEVSCLEPRQLLADTRPEEFCVILERVRLEKQQDTWDIMAGVWADVFKPFVKAGGAVDEERALPEERMFLNLVRLPQHRELWGDIVAQCATNAKKVASLHLLKQKAYEASRELFCDELDFALWRRVAVSLGLLPPGVENEGVNIHDLRGACEHVADDLEYLAAPYTTRAGRYVVKGSDCEFQRNMRGGPFTKYQALFDTRPAFDGMRYFVCFALEGWRWRSSAQL